MQRARVYANYSDKTATMMALCAILGFLKIFIFAQFNDRLNILTETIKLAVGDLFGVVVLVSVVLIGFSLSANMLYSR
eukprot:gene16288-4984_t